LVAYYSFDESSVVDDTKNNNNGIANNTIFTTGLISKAPQFNGVDSVITIPNSSSLGSVGTGLTISSWIKKDTSYGIKHQKIIAK